MDLISAYLNENSDYNNDYKHEVYLLFENRIFDGDMRKELLLEKGMINASYEKMKDLFADLSSVSNLTMESKINSELQEIRSRINKANDTKTLNEIADELVAFKIYFNKMQNDKLQLRDGILNRINISARKQIFKRQNREIEILFDKIKEKKKTL